MDAAALRERSREHIGKPNSEKLTIGSITRASCTSLQPPSSVLNRTIFYRRNAVFVFSHNLGRKRSRRDVLSDQVNWSRNPKMRGDAAAGALQYR